MRLLGNYKTKLTKEQMKANLQDACDKHLFWWSTYALKWFGNSNRFLLKANTLTFTDFEFYKKRLAICVRIKAKIKSENGETYVQLKQGLPVSPSALIFFVITMFLIMFYTGYTQGNDLGWQISCIAVPLVFGGLMYAGGYLYTNMTDEGEQAMGYTVNFLERCIELEKVK